MTDPTKQSVPKASIDTDIHEEQLPKIPSGWVIGAVLGLIIIGLAGAARHVLRLEQTVVESLAVEDAAKYSAALQEFRTIYTSEVVEPARANGIVITHDYLETPGSLPLPATMSLLLGKRLTEASGGHVRLYSDYPFPWRTPAETKLDEFQVKALATLRASPDEPVVNFFEIDGQMVVRYAAADLMREACVQCHNTHPDSPKRDWKTGDVRGVLEITRPVAGGATAARLSLQQTVRQLTGIAIFALVGLALVIVVLRRSALYSLQLASETAKANRLIGREIEHRKETEKQAIAVQKLESLGLLAGGIAHDFNNLLAGILGNAEMALLETSKATLKPKVIQRYIGLILQTGEQTKALIKQLLTYAGGHAFEKEPVNLSKRVELLAPLLVTASRHKAKLVLETDPFLPSLMGDPVQLDQVVMNLVTNASDAIDSAGGNITIRTGICLPDELDPTQSEDPIYDQDDSVSVYLEVEDDGCGMAPDIQGLIFDPFFSTKGVGRGLGLSALQGIVRDHDGTVMIASALGNGSIVRVEFNGAKFDNQIVSDSIPNSASNNGLKNVLVVDDDATVRDMTVSMLKENGFRPEAATSGAEAVQRIQVKGSPIDAVILDVCMPGEHGLDVYKTLIQHQPTLAVLFMSGFAVDEEVRTLVSQGQVSLLTKPFTMYDLSKALSGLRLRAKTESSTLP
jgi:signal transduction histidine kinase/ActR/RegA family two-component response regulator